MHSCCHAAMQVIAIAEAFEKCFLHHLAWLLKRRRENDLESQFFLQMCGRDRSVRTHTIFVKAL